MKILITAGTTGQAHKLKRLLNGNKEFVFADQEAMPFITSNYRFIRIPAGGSFSFAHEILKRCLDEQIDWVFPLRKTEIISLSEAAQLFEEYGIKLIVPARDTVENYVDLPSIKGLITVLADGAVYASEGDKEPVFSGGIQNGVYIVNPEKETDYRIFTVD